jgi:type IV pilus assembly protein PilO
MKLNQIIDKLAKIQRAQRFAIYIVCYVLLALVYFFAIYQPALSDKEAYRTEGDTLKKNMVEVEEAEREEKELELAKVRLQEDLRELKKELPNEGEITAFLKGVSDTANKVGLEVRGFTRIDEIPLAYYAEVPVEIEVYGGYHQVAKFFDELSRMKRIVYVQDVSMGAPEIEGDDVAVTVTGHAVTFRFLNDAELEAQDPNNKKKKGRKGGKKSG